MEKVKEGPYPTQYVQRWKAREGTLVTIRPIRPEDEPLMAKFHESLSEQGVYNRYLHAIKLSRRVAHTQLARDCCIDYDHEMTLVADYENLATGAHEILGVGLLSKLRTMDEAEIAVQVSDYFQGRGLGTELLRRLISVGRDEQLSRIVAHIIASNHDILRIIKRLGFRLHRRVDAAGIIKATLDLWMLLVEDSMTQEVVTVGPDTMVAEALEICQERRIRHLPVLEKGRLLGLITDRDLRTAVPALGDREHIAALKQMRVADKMTRQVIMAYPLDPLERAARAMYKRKIGCLPVVRGGDLIGIITASDVMRAQVGLVGAHKPGSSPVEIEMSNRPESLAEVAGIIRDSNVNVVSILTASADDQSSTIFRLSTIDPRRVVTTLKAAGYRVLWPPERE
jgi:acetoin utilization protein AcuB